MRLKIPQWPAHYKYAALLGFCCQQWKKFLSAIKDPLKWRTNTKYPPPHRDILAGYFHKKITLSQWFRLFYNIRLTCSLFAFTQSYTKATKSKLTSVIKRKPKWRENNLVGKLHEVKPLSIQYSCICAISYHISIYLPTETLHFLYQTVFLRLKVSLWLLPALRD